MANESGVSVAGIMCSAVGALFYVFSRGEGALPAGDDAPLPP